MTKKLMKIDELCELVDVSIPRGYELARLWEQTNGQHGLPCIRLGERQLRFSRDAVLRHLEKLEGAEKSLAEENL